MAWEAFKPVPRLTVSTLAEVRTIRLPDHTEVTLNRYSSLTYPERFKGDTREVQLQGEAYFEVAKDARHPFIVQAQEVNVKVLGTHFNVEAYQPDASIKTTLLEGRVAVNIPHTGEEMVLSPNESAIYDKERVLWYASRPPMPLTRCCGAKASCTLNRCPYRRLPGNSPTLSTSGYTLKTHAFGFTA